MAQLETNPLFQWSQEISRKLQAQFISKEAFALKGTPSKSLRIEVTDIFDLVRLSIVEICKDLAPGENNKQLFITGETVAFDVTSGKLVANFTHIWNNKP